jgi:hypothetical protein
MEILQKQTTGHLLRLVEVCWITSAKDFRCGKGKCERFRVLQDQHTGELFRGQRRAAAVFVTALSWLLRLTLADVCAVHVAANTVWEGGVRVTALSNMISSLLSAIATALPHLSLYLFWKLRKCSVPQFKTRTYQNRDNFPVSCLVRCCQR